MKRRVFLIMFVILCACGKDEPATTASGSSSGCGTISGFSMTDVNGVSILPPDTDDWRTIEDWCPSVEQLFADLPSVTYVDTALADPAVLGFPNPCSQMFALWFGNDTTSMVDLRIVDQNSHLIYSSDSITAQVITLPAQNLNVADGQLFRVYYRIVHPNGTAHRGHGDMMKE